MLQKNYFKCLPLIAACSLLSCSKTEMPQQSINTTSGTNHATAFASSLQSGFVVQKDTTVTNFFRREKGDIASDAGYSIPLSNGKVLWLTGDSYIDHYNKTNNTIPCLFQVRNAGLLQPSTTNWNWKQTSTLLGTSTGINSYLKQTADDTYWIWPGHGFQLKDTIYAYAYNMKRTGSGPWDFGSGGPDMFAKIPVATMQPATYMPLQDFNGISFGLHFVKESDGFMYVFGYKSAFINSDVFVARFPANNPNAAWTFWDGSGWNAKATAAQRIGQGASNGVDVCKWRGKYYMFSTEFSVGCDQGKNIYAAVSDTPTGPFSDRQVIYTIDDSYQGHTPFFYAVIAHTEFGDNKNLVLTYAINGYPNCFDFCNSNNRANPDWYRLRGIRLQVK